MLICNKCSKEKIQYGAYECGECRRLYLRNWNSDNREKKNARSREWVAKNKEKRSAIVKKSETKQKAVKRVWFIKYYAENKTRFQKNSRKVSKEKKLEIKMRYRARKLNAVHIPYSPKELFNKYNNLCVYCGDEGKTLDHVIPLFRGGSDTEDNLVVACKSCNSSKGTKLLDEWRAQA